MCRSIRGGCILGEIGGGLLERFAASGANAIADGNSTAAAMRTGVHPTNLHERSAPVDPSPRQIPVARHRIPSHSAPVSPAAAIHVVLGTAGHIDHGKTTLIRALTGVDTDRLPEEKKRGITIVLGFAPLDLADGTRVGVIDVPGHERFVKNMVAGAGGVDLVLLVVAADEGVMPQTREHLEICELLGVRRGVIALTKIDRADPELAELAAEDVREHLAGTSLQSAPIVPCSAVTGEGLDTLRQALAESVKSVGPKAESSTFVLPIDRTFSVKGFGSVVTGTLLSGTVAVGDQVAVLPPKPGHPTPDTIKIRSVEVFHDKVDRAHAGDRTALSLPGVELAQLSRGQVLVRPGSCVPTRVIDAQITYLSSRPKPLKSGARAQFHVGTEIVEAQLTLLDADRLPPGEQCGARLRLTEPVVALPGQRFILRGYEAATGTGRTIGGGMVLDPEPPRRRRNRPETRHTLDALRALRAELNPTTLQEAAAALIAERGVRGEAIPRLVRRLASTRGRVDKALQRAAKAQSVALMDELAVHTAAIEALGPEILARIDTFHREHTFRPAMALNELCSRIGSAVPKVVVQRAAKRLVGSQALAEHAEGYHRPGHSPFAADGAKQRDEVRQILAAAGLEPPNPAALESRTGLDKKALRELLDTMVKTGEIVRVTPTMFVAAEVFCSGRDRILAHIAKEGSISTAEAKSMTKISRRFLIPLLEYLDKQRITVRVGEVRKAGTGG